MSQRIVIDAVLLDQVLQLHSVDLAVVDDGDAVRVRHPLVPLLDPLPLQRGSLLWIGYL